MFFKKKKHNYHLCLADATLGIWDIQMIKRPTLHTHHFNIYCGARGAETYLHPMKPMPPGGGSQRSPWVGSDHRGPNRRGKRSVEGGAKSCRLASHMDRRGHSEGGGNYVQSQKRRESNVFREDMC